MSHDEHHEHLIEEVTELFEPVLTNSPQAIYIYLDDTHKICNQKFADLLGYKSVDDWVANETALDDVVEADQHKVVEAYISASQKLEASNLSISVQTQDGEELKVKMIMVPFAYQGEIFAVHYISKI